MISPSIPFYENIRCFSENVKSVHFAGKDVAIAALGGTIEIAVRGLQGAKTIVSMRLQQRSE